MKLIWSWALTCSVALICVFNSLIFQDPRLLGEIHVALLRSIIKDIEDAMTTPVTGLGANQGSAANPGGGHPQIVEGVCCSTVSCYHCSLCSL